MVLPIAVVMGVLPIAVLTSQGVLYLYGVVLQIGLRRRAGNMVSMCNVKKLRMSINNHNTSAQLSLCPVLISTSDRPFTFQLFCLWKSFNWIITYDMWRVKYEHYDEASVLHWSKEGIQKHGLTWMASLFHKFPYNWHASIIMQLPGRHASNLFRLSQCNWHASIIMELLRRRVCL